MEIVAEQWVELVGEPPVRVPVSVDWAALNSSFATRFPGDYKLLVDTYPPLVLFGFIKILHPQASVEHESLPVMAPRMLEALRVIKSRELRTNFDVHPKSGGLLPWGSTLNGDYCLWLTDGDPDEWSIVVTDLHSWWSFNGGLFDFLNGLKSGAVRCPIFPDDLLEGDVDPYQN